MKRWILLGSGLLAGFWAALEFGYYFPLTPLFLRPVGWKGPGPRTGEVTVLLAGDLLLGDAAEATIHRRGFSYPLQGVTGVVRRADLAVANLEGPIAVASPRNRAKRWSYKMPPEAGTALVASGLDGVTLANNHTLDCGRRGLVETLRYSRRAGLAVFGAGRDAAEAYRPWVAEVRGARIAFLGFLPPYALVQGRLLSLEGFRAGPGRPGAAVADPGRLAGAIRRARRVSDLVFVFFHLGDRYQPQPTAWQRELTHLAVEAGADLVVCAGTHVLGPVELYRGVPILHGLGNFVFGSGNIRARFSLVALVGVGRGGPTWHVRSVRLLPLYTVNRNPEIGYRPRFLRGWMARRVLGRLARLSRRFGASVQTGSDGIGFLAGLPWSGAALSRKKR